MISCHCKFLLFGSDGAVGDTAKRVMFLLFFKYLIVLTTFFTRPITPDPAEGYSWLVAQASLLEVLGNPVMMDIHPGAPV